MYELTKVPKSLILALTQGVPSDKICKLNHSLHDLAATAHRCEFFKIFVVLTLILLTCIAAYSSLQPC